MGITFRVDHDRRRILARGKGRLPYEEVCEYSEAVRPLHLIGYDVLFNAAAVVATITPNQVRGPAVRAQQVPAAPAPWGKTAIVANEPVVFGLSQMYATLAKSAGLRVGVFYGLVEAKAWLDSRRAPGG
jgi:hypothetical protein